MKPDARRLPRETYLCDTEDVARRLLGCRLVRLVAGRRLSGLIVETEAYLGREDLGCHASKSRTARLEAMYGPPGHAYVYFVYGMYHCLNAVTQPVGEPQAVLIRALQPDEEIRTQRQYRRNPRTGLLPEPTGIASGPGKLCQALRIGLDLYGADLVNGDRLWIEAGRSVPEGAISVGPRVGVDYAGEWAVAPLRFWVTGNPCVSKGA